MNNLKVITKVLEANNIPTFWYSIGKEEEEKVCVMQEDNGIHVFVYERGKRKQESIHLNPLNALVAISNTFDREHQQMILNYIGS